MIFAGELPPFRSRLQPRADLQVFLNPHSIQLLTELESENRVTWPISRIRRMIRGSCSSQMGLDSLDQLFDQVPPEMRLKSALRVPPALTELELTDNIGAILALNQGADRRVCFLGGGSYDHFIPAVVDNLASRGEFYTAYTPYQAEASQGTLQATFEYQTLITQLTGLDVSNASLYDGGSATAEAMLMALAITKTVRRDRGRRVGSSRVPPGPVDVSGPPGAQARDRARDAGQTSAESIAEAITDQTAAVVVQYPNFLGQLEDVRAIVAAAHAKGALAIVSVDPISLGLLAPSG